MKKIWLMGLIVLTVALWSNLGFAGNYKPGSEPDGFRGIKWGTDISTLKGMGYVRTDPSYGGVKVYARKNDDLHIGEVELERIEYSFWRGKFFTVRVVTEGFANWTGLRNAVFEKFGKGYQSNKFIEYYFWVGNITRMALEYNEVREVGKLYICSTEINKQIKAYQKQKAKEGAKTGF